MSCNSGDWANQFFLSGFRGQPWVVLRRDWRSEAFSQLATGAIGAPQSGWWFDAFRYTILHAPTFYSWAPETLLQEIILAIREFPVRRLAEFEAFERPHYERLGWPPEVIEKAGPKPGFQPNPERFSWPILLVSHDTSLGRLALLGGVASLDPLLSALIDASHVEVDEVLAIKLLLTCHGDPGTDFAKKPFTRPLHPARYKAVRALLAASTDGSSEVRDELLRQMAAAMPEVVDSLRARPPRRNATLHGAARSRLAEALSRRVDRDHRPRKGRSPWWERVAGLPERDKQLFLRSLTTSERDEVERRLSGKPSERRSSTGRVLLSRAENKFRSVLRLRIDQSS